MKNKSAVQGRRGGKVRSEAKVARKNGAIATLAKQGEASIKCNIGHAGNLSISYNLRAFECAGCGTSHTMEAVSAALAGPVTSYTGGGGVYRAK